MSATHPYDVRDYVAELVAVVDGDTVHVSVDMGFDCWQNITLRFAGINAPELTTPAGVAARQFVVARLPSRFVVRTVKDRREKYGRYLAWVMLADRSSLNRALVTADLAVAYGDLPVDPPPVDAAHA